MSNLYIGLMSGTSMDAMDAVLVSFKKNTPEIIATHQHDLPDALHTALLDLVEPGENELQRMMELDIQVGRLFADAVIQLLKHANTKTNTIQAIGSHGQTLRHLPASEYPNTLQIGDPNTIAELTGITTVADFRRRDMAAGGQGAPLVSAFHAAVFRQPDIERVVINIGGIANITYLPADPNTAVNGFDTGPGNGLMDSWIQQNKNERMDNRGQWAASGTVDKTLLSALRDDAYFSLAPPKSTGRDYFNLTWLQDRLNTFASLPAKDIQASLCELTASSIADGINNYAKKAQQILVCGGGVHNQHLMMRLSNLLPQQEVLATHDVVNGLHADVIEAAAFAWLAKQTLEHQAGNVPSVTGARHAVPLGGIYFS